jgi:hypothetical protein
MDSEEKYACVQARLCIMWTHRLLPTKRKTEVTGHRKLKNSTPRRYITSSLNLSVKKTETNTSERMSLTAIMRCQKSLYNRQLKMMLNFLWVFWSTSSATPSLKHCRPISQAIDLPNPLSETSTAPSWSYMWQRTVSMQTNKEHASKEGLKRMRCVRVRACVRERVCMNDRQSLTTSTPIMGTKEVSETTNLDPYTVQLTAREHSSEFVKS